MFIYVKDYKTMINTDFIVKIEIIKIEDFYALVADTKDGKGIIIVNGDIELCKKTMFVLKESIKNNNKIIEV